MVWWVLSQAGKRVAFYMRKGADVLSKWVGETEKQLRILFDEAKRNQPAIIFFDEIDGLAPVRSSRQDYIHSSIVSTLLALMDGLDSRGTCCVFHLSSFPCSSPSFPWPVGCVCWVPDIGEPGRVQAKW